MSLMDGLAARDWSAPGVLAEKHPVQPGNLYWYVREGEPELSYYLYLPKQVAMPQRVLVSVHGISRNVDDYITAMRPWADRHGVALVLPEYNKFDFYDYQRLGREGHGPRADLPLLGILDDIQGHFGIDTRRVDLFGFSGGAQFVHRFAMAHPARVAHLGVAAAGWYTWPDETRGYPFGVADARGLGGVRLDLAAMVRIPTCVFVGEKDTTRSRSFNTAEQLDALQGTNRLQRAENWARAMRAYAASVGVEADIRLERLPDTRHSYKQAVKRGQLLPRLFHCFYGGQ